jgi:hypothetical protein
MAEFSIGDHNYKSGRMNARQQFHVSRRLAPIFSGLADAIGDDGAPTDLNAIATAISSLPDADCDYVLNACMGVTHRQVGGGAAWGSIMTPTGAILFDDIDMIVMVHIAWEVLRDNLGGFFRALPSPSPAPGTEAPLA